MMHPRRSILLLLSAAGSVSTVRMHGAIRAAAHADAKLTTQDVVSVVSKVIAGEQHMQVTDVLNFGGRALSSLLATQFGKEEDCNWFCKFLERAQADPIDVAILGVKLYNAYSSTVEYVGDIRAAEVDSAEWLQEIDNLKAVFSSTLYSAFETAAADAWKESDEGKNAKLAWTNGWADATKLQQAFRDIEAGQSEKAWQPVLQQGADALVAALKVGAPLHTDIWETLDESLTGAISGWENIVDEKWALALGDVWTAFYALWDQLGDLWPVAKVADVPLENKVCQNPPSNTAVGTQRGCEKRAKDANKDFYQFKAATGGADALCDVCDNADTTADLADWKIFQRPAEDELSKRLRQMDTIITKLRSTIDAFEAKKKNLCNAGDPTVGHCVCTRKKVERKVQDSSQCFHGFTFDPTTKICVPEATNGADCEAKCSPGGNLDKACPEFCPANKRYCCSKTSSQRFCSRATFVDLDFAQGDAENYYQCVSPALEVGDEAAAAELDEESSRLPGTILLQATPQESSLLQRASLTAQGSQISSVSSLDRATARKGGKDEQIVLPNGAARPQCDPDSAFRETIDGNEGKCFESCDSGYAPILSDGDNPVPTTKCIQKCSANEVSGLRSDGVFGIVPVDTGSDALEWEVCGITEPYVENAKTESVTVMTDVLTEIVQAVDKITKNNDLTQAELDQLADEISKAFTHFVRPECGKEYEPAPAPAPPAGR